MAGRLPERHDSPQQAACFRSYGMPDSSSGIPSTAPSIMKPAALLLASLLLSLANLRAAPLNILVFTADDMNYDSTGVCGGPIKDLTPNVDRLASEGLRFEYAY